jgi:hypothetical protein
MMRRNVVPAVSTFFVSFFRLVIPPQANSSSNVSVLNKWGAMGACPKCSQIVDISRFFGGHDVWKENKPQQILPPPPAKFEVRGDRQYSDNFGCIKFFPR